MVENNSDSSKFKNNEDRLKYLDNQLETLVEHQEAELLVDFDAAIEEHEKQNKPYKIKFNNKFFLVPNQMPFDFATFFFRYCYKKVKGKIIMEVPDEKLLRFIELMFGREMLQALESGKKRVEMSLVFETLSMPILEKWGYGLNDSESKKKIIQGKIIPEI